MSEGNVVDILLVDDRPENLLAFEGLLAQPGRRIFQARSGNEALALTLEYDFALVLLDVQMPEMDGFEVARLMRSYKRTRSLPIIFVTARHQESDHVFEGYEAGAVDYLFKPVDPHTIESKVRVFCELRTQQLTIQDQLEEIAEKNQQLEQQLAEIKTLRGFIPICAGCKKIREDDGFWEHVEVYISERSDARFSHGMCPSCLVEHYPEVFSDEADAAESYVDHRDSSQVPRRSVRER